MKFKVATVKLENDSLKHCVMCRLVVLESGLGLESGLESIFAGLGLGLELKGLGLGLGLETPGLGLGLGSFFLQVLCQVHL